MIHLARLLETPKETDLHIICLGDRLSARQDDIPDSEHVGTSPDRLTCRPCDILSSNIRANLSRSETLTKRARGTISKLGTAIKTEI